MSRSPLRYPGGKSKIVELLRFYAPLDFEEYREPFVGGGSFFFYLKKFYPKRTFWINDAFKELYLFYKELQRQSPSVIREIRCLKKRYANGRKLYERSKKLVEEGTDIQKAAAFFILNRITFSGTIQSGGYSEQAFQKRFTESSIERLEKTVSFLDSVKITNEDYSVLLQESGENVFIFLDPPYYSAKKLYGRNGELHKDFDYERLSELLCSTRHRWLMTIDDCDYVRSLFDFAIIEEVNMTYGMKKKEKRTKELLIRNYR